jgi:hypothetical protein
LPIARPLVSFRDERRNAIAHRADSEMENAFGAALSRKHHPARDTRSEECKVRHARARAEHRREFLSRPEAGWVEIVEPKIVEQPMDPLAQHHSLARKNVDEKESTLIDTTRTMPLTTRVPVPARRTKRGGPGSKAARF